MSEHCVEIRWKRTTNKFDYKSFDRTHTLIFPGGITANASSAPEYLGKAKYVNPEESEKIHKLAHTECFISNSVKTDIEIRAKKSVKDGIYFN